jgi:hypothetical protein
VSGKAHDAAGNGNNASTSTDNSVVYDNTAPDVACGTADGNWHAADVSIHCTASDTPAGLANASDASFNLVTNVDDGTETNTASTNSRTIFDRAGNSAPAGPITGNKVDKKAPEFALTCPLVQIVLNDPNAKASWTASDGGSGLTGAASGNITLTVNSVGAKTLNVPAGFVKDNVGHDGPAASCNYSVGYKFFGLDAPVDKPNTYNLSKAGQAIPLKWRLLDYNNAPVTNFTAAALGVAVSGMVCTVNASLDQIEEYTGASGLQNLGDGYYQFNWKTPASYANSCKSIGLNLGEGTPRGPLAYFNFKK